MGAAGTIFDISRGCVDDGPGLRTVVFLKGCALGCPWCQNPEGISFRPEIAFDAARCVRSGRCREACPRAWPPAGDPDAWRTGCEVRARCVDVCPSHARRLVGRAVEVDVLVAEVLADRPYFRGTGGGVTFSGGEPLCQPAFVLAGAAALRAAGVHVAVETAGFFPADLAEPLARAVDLVLFDLKHVDAERFRTGIGRGPGAILDNLRAILSTGTPVEMRLTLVPGFNDSDDDIDAIGRFLASGPRVPPVRLQAFHRLALSKVALYGRPYPYAAVEPPPPGRLARAAEILGSHGVAIAR